MKLHFLILVLSFNVFGDDWLPLTNEPSRQQLFQLVKPDDITSKALEKAFQFPHDTTFDDIQNVPRENSIFGLDISHHNGVNIRFDVMREQDVRFVYMKATQGTTHKDPRFAQNWKAVGDLPDNKKILRGAYHFLSSMSDPVAQADRFIEFLKLNGGLNPGDLPPVMDLEWDISSTTGTDRWSNHSPSEIVKRALAFLNRVREKTGRTPMIYTARSWWRERNIPESDFEKLAPFRVWIADYSASSRGTEIPKVPNASAFELWQFTDSSKLSFGHTGGFDANIFKGTEDEFQRAFFAE